jgi:hypothetical protein
VVDRGRRGRIVRWDLPAARVGMDSATESGSCPSGQILCGGACVDPNNDLQHCGGCTTTCRAGPHSQPTCSAGLCGATCESGFVNCDGNPETSGCSVAAATGCGECDQGTSSCDPTAQFVCRPFALGDAAVSRCCRALVNCGPSTCGAPSTCVRVPDFDLCCAIGM